MLFIIVKLLLTKLGNFNFQSAQFMKSVIKIYLTAFSRLGVVFKFITYCNCITGFEASAVLLVQLFLLDNNLIWITDQPSRELQSLTKGK